MKIGKKYDLCRAFMMLFLVLGMTGMMLQARQVSAYAADFLVEDYSDMLECDGYIYYIRSMTKDAAQMIYRMNVATGKVTKLGTFPNGVSDMRIADGVLFYTTIENDVYQTYCCELDGSDVVWVCEGRMVYVSGNYLYAIKDTAGKECLFYVNLSAHKTRSVKTVSQNQTIAYIKSVGDLSYYYIYDTKVKKLYLYSLRDGEKKLVKITSEKNTSLYEDGGIMVSDVELIRGELYYDYGSIQGTGHFWYGKIKKITSSGEKKTVAKDTGSETIVAGSRELYYNDSVGDKYYKYNLSTGKTDVFTMRYENNISYIIYGDKTYMADTTDKSRITLSRFTSGTDRQTLTKNMININYKQKMSINYSVSMKKIGSYNLVSVTGMDFSDAAYGWRGRVDSIKWFVTDGAGKVLGSFS